jgi:hypothetical protein
MATQGDHDNRARRCVQRKPNESTTPPVDEAKALDDEWDGEEFRHTGLIMPESFHATNATICQRPAISRPQGGASIIEYGSQWRLRRQMPLSFQR